jgi:hypothetical protein
MLSSNSFFTADVIMYGASFAGDLTERLRLGKLPRRHSDLYGETVAAFSQRGDTKTFALF